MENENGYHTVGSLTTESNSLLTGTRTKPSTQSTTKRPLVPTLCLSSIPICGPEQIIITVKIGDMEVYCCIDVNCKDSNENAHEYYDYEAEKSPTIGNVGASNTHSISRDEGNNHLQILEKVRFACSFEELECPSNTFQKKVTYSEVKAMLCCIHEIDSKSEPASSESSIDVSIKGQVTNFVTLENCYSSADSCEVDRYYAFNFYNLRIYCCIDPDKSSPSKQSRKNEIFDVIDDCESERRVCQESRMLVRLIFTPNIWCCMPKSTWMNHKVEY